MITEERRDTSMAALDARIAKARAGAFQVVAKAEKLFVVTHGGDACEVDFRPTNTGVCNCPDFASQGSYLHACQHTAAVVLNQWPNAFDRWEVKVRALVRASNTRLAADPEAEPAPAVHTAAAGPGAAAAAAAVPAAIDEQLVTAVVQVLLSLVMARVLAVIDAAAPEITRQVLADVSFAALSSAAQEVVQP